MFLREEDDSGVVGVGKHILAISAGVPVLEEVVDVDVEEKGTEEAALRHSSVEFEGRLTNFDERVPNAKSNDVLRLL